MEIHAYDEEYVGWAQRVLGDAFDFALVTVGIPIGEFEKVFLTSDFSKQFADGNPAYVVGRTGCEFVLDMYEDCGKPIVGIEPSMYIDKSPEFWTGWALAFYQWYSSKSFREIVRAVSLSDILDMYDIYHEMDIMKFADEMEERFASHREETRLKRLREYANLSQSQLSKASGVPLRQIQLFEQRQRDINKTQVMTIVRLSKTLNCQVADLIEG